MNSTRRSCEEHMKRERMQSTQRAGEHNVMESTEARETRETERHEP